MIGIIKRCNMPKAKPVNPDDYFDPTTHIATEANFIKLLQDGYYEESLIGYKVQLSNSVDYNNGLWVIADVNHDSDNTGQTNCYDLIPQDCFYSTAFDDGSPYQYWRDSLPRTWLNSTFYNGFSENFKSHMNNIIYDSNGSTYNDDKVILPSFTELNGGTSSYVRTEGTQYPIFADNASRKKYQNGTTSNSVWWTRSRYTKNDYIVWFVDTDGAIGWNTRDYWNYYYLAPVLRVS